MEEKRDNESLDDLFTTSPGETKTVEENENLDDLFTTGKNPWVEPGREDLTTPDNQKALSIFDKVRNFGVPRGYNAHKNPKAPFWELAVEDVKEIAASIGESGLETLRNWNKQSNIEKAMTGPAAPPILGAQMRTGWGKHALEDPFPEFFSDDPEEKKALWGRHIDMFSRLGAGLIEGGKVNYDIFTGRKKWEEASVDLMKWWEKSEEPIIHAANTSLRFLPGLMEFNAIAAGVESQKDVNPLARGVIWSRDYIMQKGFRTIKAVKNAYDKAINGEPGNAFKDLIVNLGEEQDPFVFLERAAGYKEDNELSAEGLAKEIWGETPDKDVKSAASAFAMAIGVDPVFWILWGTHKGQKMFNAPLKVKDLLKVDDKGFAMLNKKQQYKGLKSLEDYVSEQNRIIIDKNASHKAKNIAKLKRDSASQKIEDFKDTIIGGIDVKTLIREVDEEIKYFSEMEKKPEAEVSFEKELPQEMIKSEKEMSYTVEDFRSRREKGPSDRPFFGERDVVEEISTPVINETTPSEIPVKVRSSKAKKQKKVTEKDKKDLEKYIIQGYELRLLINKGKKNLLKAGEKDKPAIEKELKENKDRLDKLSLIVAPLRYKVKGEPAKKKDTGRTAKEIAGFKRSGELPPVLPEGFSPGLMKVLENEGPKSKKVLSAAVLEDNAKLKKFFTTLKVYKGTRPDLFEDIYEGDVTVDDFWRAQAKSKGMDFEFPAERDYSDSTEYPDRIIERQDILSADFSEITATLLKPLEDYLKIDESELRTLDQYRRSQVDNVFEKVLKTILTNVDKFKGRDLEKANELFFRIQRKREVLNRGIDFSKPDFKKQVSIMKFWKLTDRLLNRIDEKVKEGLEDVEFIPHEGVLKNKKGEVILGSAGFHEKNMNLVIQMSKTMGDVDFSALLGDKKYLFREGLKDNPSVISAHEVAHILDIINDNYSGKSWFRNAVLEDYGKLPEGVSFPEMFAETFEMFITKPEEAFRRNPTIYKEFVSRLDENEFSLRENKIFKDTFLVNGQLNYFLLDEDFVKGLEIGELEKFRTAAMNPDLITDLPDINRYIRDVLKVADKEVKRRLNQPDHLELTEALENEHSGIRKYEDDLKRYKEEVREGAFSLYLGLPGEAKRTLAEYKYLKSLIEESESFPKEKAIPIINNAINELSNSVKDEDIVRSLLAGNAEDYSRMGEDGYNYLESMKREFKDSVDYNGMKMGIDPTLKRFMNALIDSKNKYGIIDNNDFIRTIKAKEAAGKALNEILDLGPGEEYDKKFEERLNKLDEHIDEIIKDEDLEKVLYIKEFLKTVYNDNRTSYSNQTLYNRLSNMREKVHEALYEKPGLIYREGFQYFFPEARFVEPGSKSLSRLEKAARFYLNVKKALMFPKEIFRSTLNWYVGGNLKVFDARGELSLLGDAVKRLGDKETVEAFDVTDRVVTDMSYLEALGYGDRTYYVEEAKKIQKYIDETVGLQGKGPEILHYLARANAGEKGLRIPLQYVKVVNDIIKKNNELYDALLGTSETTKKGNVPKKQGSYMTQIATEGETVVKHLGGVYGIINMDSPSVLYTTKDIKAAGALSMLYHQLEGKRVLSALEDSKTRDIMYERIKQNPEMRKDLGQIQTPEALERYYEERSLALLAMERSGGRWTRTEMERLVKKANSDIIADMAKKYGKPEMEIRKSLRMEGAARDWAFKEITKEWKKSELSTEINEGIEKRKAGLLKVFKRILKEPDLFKRERLFYGTLKKTGLLNRLINGDTKKFIDKIYNNPTKEPPNLIFREMTRVDPYEADPYVAPVRQPSETMTRTGKLWFYRTPKNVLNWMLTHAYNLSREKMDLFMERMRDNSVNDLGRLGKEDVEGTGKARFSGFKKVIEDSFNFITTGATKFGTKLFGNSFDRGVDKWASKLSGFFGWADISTSVSTHLVQQTQRAYNHVYFGAKAAFDGTAEAWKDLGEWKRTGRKSDRLELASVMGIIEGLVDIVQSDWDPSVTGIGSVIKGQSWATTKYQNADAMLRVETLYAWGKKFPKEMNRAVEAAKRYSEGIPPTMDSSGLVVLDPGFAKRDMGMFDKNKEWLRDIGLALDGVNVVNVNYMRSGQGRFFYNPFFNAAFGLFKKYDFRMTRDALLGVVDLVNSDWDIDAKTGKKFFRIGSKMAPDNLVVAKQVLPQVLVQSLLGGGRAVRYWGMAKMALGGLGLGWMLLNSGNIERQDRGRRIMLAGEGIENSLDGAVKKLKSGNKVLGYLADVALNGFFDATLGVNVSDRMLMRYELAPLGSLGYHFEEIYTAMSEGVPQAYSNEIQRVKETVTPMPIRQVLGGMMILRMALDKADAAGELSPEGKEINSMLSSITGKLGSQYFKVVRDLPNIKGYATWDNAVRKMIFGFSSPEQRKELREYKLAKVEMKVGEGKLDYETSIAAGKGLVLKSREEQQKYANEWAMRIRAGGKGPHVTSKALMNRMDRLQNPGKTFRNEIVGLKDNPPVQKKVLEVYVNGGGLRRYMIEQARINNEESWGNYLAIKGTLIRQGMASDEWVDKIFSEKDLEFIASKRRSYHGFGK